MLEADAITVKYGGLVAVKNFTLSVPVGSLVGLIGPNGAGKTSLIDAVSGFTPYEGSVRFEGAPLDELSPHLRARKGLVRTFQSVELFRDLSVLDNLRVQAERAGGSQSAADPDEDTFLAEILDMLELGRYANHAPDELPHGTRRLVGIARALACRPRLLLMDEPAAGLDAAETRDLAVRLRTIVGDGRTSILLVDHDMELVMSVCDGIYVMDFGTSIAHGSPEAVRRDDAVVDAYLGGGDTRSDRPVPAAPRRSDRSAPPVLAVSSLTTGYEGVPVVHDVDLEVRPGEIVALLGPNGAGKTTTLSTISGLVRPMSGDVVLAGESIAGQPPHRITRKGLLHVPEDRSLVFGLTASENLKLAGWGPAPSVDPLELFPEVERRLHSRAGLLSGGEQQMLAVARALVAGPKVLMVDEMSLGLAPVIVERLFETLRSIARDHGVGVLLVEQHVQLALKYADRAYVLVGGTVRASGSVHELAADWQAIEASYLGDSAHDTDSGPMGAPQGG